MIKNFKIYSVDEAHIEIEYIDDHGIYLVYGRNYGGDTDFQYTSSDLFAVIYNFIDWADHNKSCFSLWIDGEMVFKEHYDQGGSYYKHTEEECRGYA